jgi:hypothetical protein
MRDPEKIDSGSLIRWGGGAIKSRIRSTASGKQAVHHKSPLNGGSNWIRLPCVNILEDVASLHHTYATAGTRHMNALHEPKS